MFAATVRALVDGGYLVRTSVLSGQVTDDKGASPRFQVSRDSLASTIKEVGVSVTSEVIAKVLTGGT